MLTQNCDSFQSSSNAAMLAGRGASSALFSASIRSLSNSLARASFSAVNSASAARA